MAELERPRFRLALLHPRHWLLWLAVGLWWLSSLLPYRVLLWLGFQLGHLLQKLARKRCHIARRNLQLCFPELNEKEQAQLLRQHFEAMGMALFETAMAWWWPKWRLRRLFTIVGAEHMLALEGQGTLMLSMHVACMELGSPLTAQVRELDGLYRPHKNPVMDWLQAHFRGRHSHSSELIPRADMRGMVRALKRGRMVWYGPDQDYGINQGVFAPFFGIPAATITATAKLARLGKARVVPAFPSRNVDGSGYTFTIYPALEDFPSGDDVADCSRLNALFEREIRRHPEQYMWVHRRFKNRPPGEDKVY